MSRGLNRIYTEEITTTNKEGDTTTKRLRQIHREPQEDAYIKVYIRMLGAIANLPPGASPLLQSLLSRMSYANTGQEVVINSIVRDRICDEAKIGRTQFYKQIKVLIERGVLIPPSNWKQGRNQYLTVFTVNPNIIGRGDWSDIKEIRSSITLNKYGARILSSTSDEESIEVFPVVDNNQQDLFDTEHGLYIDFKETEVSSAEAGALSLTERTQGEENTNGLA